MFNLNRLNLPRKKILSLIFLLTFLIALPISVYTVITQRMEIRKEAREKPSNWIEIDLGKHPQIKPKASSQEIKGKIFKPKKASLPITGEWQSRTVKIVPNSYFDDLFKTYYGINALEIMNGNRLFLGTYNGFAIKETGDSDWQNLQYFYLPPGLQVNMIKEFTQTLSLPFDIYINGLEGVIRYQSDGTMQMMPDPSGERMQNMEHIVPYASNNGAVGYKNHELYYLENGTVRKWLTPVRYPCAWSDDILTIVTDTTEWTKKTYGIVREGCPGAPDYKTYLYQFLLSSNPETPLQMIRLGEVANQQSLGKVKITRRADDESQKILYGQPEYTTNMIPIIPYFKTDGSPITIERYQVESESGRYPYFPAGFVEEKTGGNSDNLWVVAGESRGVYLGNNFDKEDTEGSFVRTEDTSILANPYLNSIALDSEGRAFVAHKYLTGQFNEALATIFEPPKPTPTPTPTSTPTPTPTPMPSFTFPLKKGWNSFALPLEVSYQASELLKEIKEGGSCQEIAWLFGSGAWDYYPTNPYASSWIIDKYTPTFFVLCDRPGSFSLSGSPLSFDISQLYLTSSYSSWDGVSVPVDEGVYTAETLCQAIDDYYSGECQEIDRWNGTAWESHSKGSPFNNFPLKKGEGYYIKYKVGDQPVTPETLSNPTSPVCQKLFELWKSKFGTHCGASGYDIKADINNDGLVDIVDFSIWKTHPEEQVWCQSQLDDATNPCVD